MLGNVLKIDRAPTRPQLSEPLRLPDFSDDLIAAERSHAELVAKLAAVRTDFETLNMGFDDYRIMRADGTPFPTEGRKDLLVKLYRDRAELESAEGDAVRILLDARRKFGEQAAMQVKPEIDKICEKAIEHLEQAEHLVRLLSALGAEVKASGVPLRNPQMERASYLAEKLYTARSELVPTPAVGLR